MNYSDFVTESFKKLQKKQDELYRKYDLNSYANWFYDQASGLLTFSDDGKELNFRYYEVGTFSKTTKTWKWSWDNEHTLKKVKEKIEEVKKCGQKANYKKLTEGLFDSHEDEGWDFTSISSNILSGIGAYRPQTERHFIFMVLYEVVDNKTANEEKEKYVDCENHERRRRAFVANTYKKGVKTDLRSLLKHMKKWNLNMKTMTFKLGVTIVKKLELKKMDLQRM